MLARMDDDPLAHWNALPAEAASVAILPCCGSRAWANAMSARRPIQNPEQLLTAAAEVWCALPEHDWHEAFRSHPRIGERHAAAATARSAAWSAEEQRTAATPGSGEQLAAANRLYQQRFGRTFVICATGKTAPQILVSLRQRLHHSPDEELRIAAEEQRRITEVRLRRWMEEGAHGWASPPMS